ncbi:MAG: tetratricopeptide repeat protein [Candidatus Methanofastidiosia archaeon]
MTVREWLEKGHALLRFERPEEALEVIEEVLKSDPSSVHAWNDKGAALSVLERYEEALKAFEKAIELNSYNVYAWNEKGYVLGSLERYEEALKAFERVLMLDSSNVPAWNGKGIAFLTLRRYEEALKAFEKVIELNPDDPTAWDGKATVLISLERYGEAIDALEKTFKLGSSSEMSIITLGELFFVLGDLENAFEKVTETLSINNENISALILKGRIEIERRRYNCAVKHFEEAAHSDLGNPLPLLWKIYAEYLNLESSPYIRTTRYQEEITAIIRKLEILNTSYEKYGRKELRASILYFLGYFYYRSKDFFTAKEKLRDCVMLKSNEAIGEFKAHRTRGEKLTEIFRPETSVEKYARGLLDSIWNFEIRPTWWCWWFSSPLYCWTKRVLFILLMSTIFSLLFLHPFIPKWFSVEVNWVIYTISIVFLIFILLSPTLQSVTAEKFGLELRSPSSFDLVLSPSEMETRIKELEKHYKK